MSMLTSSTILDANPNSADPNFVDDFAPSAPGLAANQICRITFAIIGIILCWVPLRLLSRNGEFVAVVFIIDVVVTNIFTILNASIWPNDDLVQWWSGPGFCDLEVYLLLPMQCLYASCIFALMRNLAGRLRLRRASDLTPRERKRQLLIQSSIIFTMPILQILLNWFVLTNRYVIGTVVGCYGMYGQNWFKIIVFLVPPAAFSVATIPYAFLTWKRFRDISKTTQMALAANSEANSRAQRTRRRLYQMAISIIIPYAPLQLVFFILNLRQTFMFWEDYDFYDLHYGIVPYPWDAVVMLPSWLLDFAALNQPWIPILTTIPIVMFFGMTKEAIDAYRRFLVMLRLDTCFPGLREPYDPDRPREIDSSQRGLMNSALNRKIGTTDISSSLASTIQQSQLPNTYHQSIVSSAGPFIPPRHSSSSQQRPEIPPRHSSLQRSLFRNSTWRTIPVRLPSLSTIRSSMRKSTRDQSSSSLGIATNATEQSIPLRSWRPSRTIWRAPPRPPSPSTRPSSHGQEGDQAAARLPRLENGNVGENDWTVNGTSWSRPATHLYSARGRPIGDVGGYEDAGDGFVRIKITGGSK